MAGWDSNKQIRRPNLLLSELYAYSSIFEDKTGADFDLRTKKKMGGSLHGRVSNATQFPLFYAITDSELEVQDAEVTTSVGGKVSGDVTAEGPKLGAEITANYENKSKLKRIRSKGEARVAKMQSSDQGLVLDPSSNDKAYFSVWAKVNGADLVIIQNLRVRVEDDIRLCIWIEGGEFVWRQLCKEPKAWRLKGHGSVRNYPPNFVCNTCSESVTCRSGCSEQAEYGGLVR